MRTARQARWRGYGMILVAGLAFATVVLGCKSAAPPPSNTEVQPQPAPPTVDTKKESASEAAVTGGVTGSVAGPTAGRKPLRHRKPAAPETAAQKPAEKSPEEKLEEAVSRLKVGGLAYSFPEKMKTGQREDVVASIGSDKVPIAVLKAHVAGEDGQEVKTEQTPVTPKMKMTLTSADFDITPQSSDEQMVVGTTPTTWRWTIAPRHSGKLHLHLAAIIELEDLKQDYTTVDRDVAVQVDPLDMTEKFIQNNWQWLLSGGGGVAVAGAVWKLFKRKKESGDDDPV
ncbi:MAG TPA: hypothetical protein VHN81_13435 [Edaphobacter sp.]|nr:hypothetical protein [Edaphobacter sp.]